MTPQYILILKPILDNIRNVARVHIILAIFKSMNRVIKQYLFGIFLSKIRLKKKVSLMYAVTNKIL